MERRARRALIAGACLLAFELLHFGWFLLFGPPEWFEGVGERAPEMTAVRLESAFDPYIDAAGSPRVPRMTSPGAEAPATVEGRVVREDRVSPDGPALLQSRAENLDRLYVSAGNLESWEEIPLGLGGRAGQARWVRTAGAYRILIERQRPWWPRGENYGRFWAALLRPDLRSESSLFLLDPPRWEAGFLSAGRLPTPSPDRTAVAFLRSERRGFHALHLWTPGAKGILTVVSLWEADPGSGPSFDWSWSDDSRVLFVRGRTRGFAGSPEGSAREVRLLYDVAGDRLVDLSPP